MYYGLRVLIKDIGRRLPLQLQCSYQDQQGDARKSVRGNCKARFWGGQNLTAVEGNASVYQVNPVGRITGEGRVEVLSTWGAEFDQKGGGGGWGGGGGGWQSGRLNLCEETINSSCCGGFIVPVGANYWFPFLSWLYVPTL